MRLCGLLLTVITIAVSGVAHAGEVSVIETDSGRVAQFTAALGEKNNLKITVRPSGIRFEDPAGRIPTSAGPGCRQVQDAAVCGGDRVALHLRDENDRVYADCPRTCVSFLIRGGTGNDVLAGAERRDRIFGGAGFDNIDAIDGGDRIFGGPGPDYIRGVIAGENSLISCGQGIDYVFPHPTMTLARDCDGFGETGWGYSRFSAVGNRLHLRIRTLGCRVGLRLGGRGPTAVAERRPKSYPITFVLPDDGQQRVQLFGRRLCDGNDRYRPLFRIAAR